MVKYLKMENVPVEISEIIYGTATKPMMVGEDSSEMLDFVVSQGVTTLDTARSYGQSEQVIGRWMDARGNRDKLCIISKGCNPEQTGLQFSPESLREELGQSLEALKTDCIDLYAIHRDVPGEDVGVFIELLNALVQEGKIRAFGASNWTHVRMRDANRYAARHGLQGFTFGEPAYSLAVMVGDPFGGSVHLSGRDKAEARKWFLQAHIPIFAYSALARGFFSGAINSNMPFDEVRQILPPETCTEYLCQENMDRLRIAEKIAANRGATVTQIALAWVLCQPVVGGAIIGPTTQQHFLQDLQATNMPLDNHELAELNMGSAS
ncbi:MAG: aldo/keto reductase [Clostridia bacterium]|nr:aldo/keto reductase [Clostridia bacterium]